jgi:hypothetical protein
LFLIDLVWNWDQNWNAMKDGWKGGGKDATTGDVYYSDKK